MIKRSKFLLCALASVGVITSFNTINANAMTNSSTTTKCVQHQLKGYDVVDMIYDLPDSYKITLKDTCKVIKVRLAYESLSKDEKSKVEKYDLYYLKDAESKIGNSLKVVFDKIRDKNLVKRIEKLKTDVDYVKKYDGKVTVNKDKLKSKVEEIKNIRKDYEKLEYSYTYEVNQLVNNYYDFLSIECNLAQL